jgi:hypothetical protein
MRHTYTHIKKIRLASPILRYGHVLLRDSIHWKTPTTYEEAGSVYRDYWTARWVRAYLNGKEALEHEADCRKVAVGYNARWTSNTVDEIEPTR